MAVGLWFNLCTCRSLTLLPLFKKWAVAFTVNIYISGTLPNVHVFRFFQLAVVLRVNFGVSNIKVLPLLKSAVGIWKFAELAVALRINLSHLHPPTAMV